MLPCNAQAELELKEENEGLNRQLADSLVQNHKLVEEGKKRRMIDTGSFVSWRRLRDRETIQFERSRVETTSSGGCNRR